MRAGWKTRIDERRYFEEKKRKSNELASKAAICNAQRDIFRESAARQYSGNADETSRYAQAAVEQYKYGRIIP